jgi:hypothetical protein
MLQDWIFEQNLKSVLELLAEHAGYDFDPDEWNAVRFGVAETDAERDRWYKYEFTGERRVAFSLARDSGSSIINLKVESDPDTESKIETVIWIAQHYRITTFK